MFSQEGGRRGESQRRSGNESIGQSDPIAGRDHEPRDAGGFLKLKKARNEFFSRASKKNVSLKTP